MRRGAHVADNTLKLAGARALVALHPVIPPKRVRGVEVDTSSRRASGPRTFAAAAADAVGDGTVVRIAILTQRFPRLSERFTLLLATGLIDLGHEVDVFANLPPEEDVEHREFREYGLAERTYYGVWTPPRLEQRPRALRAWIAGKHASAVLRRSARSHQGLQQLAERSYDVYHAQFGPEGIRGLVLRDAGLLRGALVTTFRGFDAGRYPRQQGQHVYEPLFRQGDRFFAVDETLRERIVALGCPSERVAVTPSPIDARGIAARLPTRKEEGPARLLTVARLTEKKGVAIALRAVAELVSSGRDVRYDIVGDGELREPLRAQAAALGLDTIAIFHGAMAHDRVLERFGQADVYVGPSVTAADGDCEGVPNVLKEALAAGVPVVATRHGGIPGLIRHKRTGLLVPEHDAGTLARRIAQILDHPDLAVGLVRAGRECVERDYDSRTVLPRLVDEYRRALVGSPTA